MGKKRKKMEKGKQAKMCSEKLPREIMEDILSRLPVESLLQFRCVCKAWYSLLTNPRFVKLHLDRATKINRNPNLFLSYSNGERLYYVKDFESSNKPTQLLFPSESPFTRMNIVGSCNGLLCLCEKRRRSHSIYLWNPATREYKKLPPAPAPIPSIHQCHYRNRFRYFGFGYDGTSEEYKVVVVSCTVPRDEGSPCDEVRVYTLGTDRWRRLGIFPDKRPLTSIVAFGSLFVNRGLHWLAFSDLNMDDKSIISFDLRDEEFRYLLLPDHDYDPVHIIGKTLGELGGCLSYSHILLDERIEIWVMKDYGIRDSWTKQFVIELSSLIESSVYYMNPLGILKNGEILLNQDANKLILYDPITEKVRDLVCCRTEESHNLAACPFIWSLVSLSGESTEVELKASNKGNN